MRTAVVAALGAPAVGGPPPPWAIHRWWVAARRRSITTSPACAASAKRPHSGAPSKQQQQSIDEAGSGKKLARSVRAMPIKVISISKADSAGGVAFAEEWLAKLRRYAPAELVTIKPNPLKARDVEVAKAAEAQKVLSHLSPRDRVVVLCERGAEVTSEGVASIIASSGDDGTPLVFVIGGPFGHGAEICARADSTIRLSRLVLNHSVALVVLLEQLYRGWTILNGSPYHH